MIRPHVVSFLDEMLKSEENLRVEEIVVPSGFPETPVGELNVKGRDHLVVALREQNEWVFNPDSSHLLRAGTVMVIMATPSGRKAVEGKLGWV